MRYLKIIITILILSPLIEFNYWQRGKGYKPDDWYWADMLVLDWRTIKYCWAY